MIGPFASNFEPDPIETRSDLIELLVDRLRQSQPEILTFASVLSDVEAMINDVLTHDQYRPPQELAFVLIQSICSEEHDLVRCGRGLLEFYGIVPGIAKDGRKPVSTAKIIHIALIALGAARTVTFTRIIGPTGLRTESLLIASKAAFEDQYGARIRVILSDPVLTVLKATPGIKK